MNLIDFLKKNENTRKIFGKREIEIMDKQLNGINLTQSEKNRLSRDIRKKFGFIKEINQHDFNLDLKKSNNVKIIIEETKAKILNSGFKGIKRIILFGSAAENKLTPRSDIDLAVEFTEITLREATKFRSFISGRVDGKMDIQVYNILEQKIKKEIDLKGRAIW